MGHARSLIAAPLLFLLAGCSFYSADLTDERPGLVPAPDSVIVLNQAIKVHPGYSRSFIQHGRGIQRSELEEREPWCQFRLYEPPAALETMRSIDADRFIVTKSYRAIETFAQGYPAIASLDLPFLLIPDRDHPDRNLSSIMRIQSASQPRVIEFKCAVLTEPLLHNYLSLQQMRETLGDVVSLELQPIE